MKHLRQIVFAILLAILSISCNQKKNALDKVSSSDSNTIQIFAQDRPGGQAYNFDMPIDEGLDKLEITDLDGTDIDSTELVLGISIDNTPLAVPIKYLSGFEVANLNIDSDNYLLTWCPLVGSARIFEGELKGDKSGFDFGRGLKDNNLLIIDRKTKSVWNQLSCKAIEGELKGETLLPLPSIQSTWAFWKNKYPNTKVVINRDTSNAVFPKSVLKKPYYRTWIPGNEYPKVSGHEIKTLGLGIDLDSSALFLSFEKLFEEESPLVFQQKKGPLLYVHFDADGLTAWVEDSNGVMIPSTVVYDWAWNNFYPDTNTYN